MRCKRVESLFAASCSLFDKVSAQLSVSRPSACNVFPRALASRMAFASSIAFRLLKPPALLAFTSREPPSSNAPAVPPTRKVFGSCETSTVASGSTPVTRRRAGSMRSDATSSNPSPTKVAANFPPVLFATCLPRTVPSFVPPIPPESFSMAPSTAPLPAP